MEGYLIDASPTTEGTELVLATDHGLARVRARIRYSAHVLTRPDPRILAEQIMSSEDSIEASVEEMLAPPDYRVRVRVLMLVSDDLETLTRVVHRLEASGVGREVNRVHRLAVALKMNNAPPGSLVRVESGRISPLEDVDDPLYETPSIRYVKVTALAWHGLAMLSDRVVGAMIRCGKEEFVVRPDEVVEGVRYCRPHVVIARFEDRVLIPGLDSDEWVVMEQPLAGSMEGVIEWSRISGLPLPEAAVAPIGKVLTTAEAAEAMRRGYILDPSIPRIEGWRTVWELAAADLAGGGRVPEPGTYWGVAQLDFNSLYPSIIVKHKLSAETVGVACWGGTVPEGGIHPVCTDKEGVVPSVLRKLIWRRAMQKDAGLVKRADAVKWLLVAAFGYLGYRNSLFGSIQAYENVTSIARHTLLKAEAVAEKMGYRVIHSIVDSIFIQPASPSAPQPEEVAAEIKRVTGLSIRVESRYVWLTIPAIKDGLRGAANKYFGLTAEGQVRVKGLAVIRRDTPKFVKDAQSEALAILASARNPGEYKEALASVSAVFAKKASLLLNNKVPLTDLVITKRSSLTPRRVPQAFDAARAGLVGGVVKYVMTPAGPLPVTHVKEGVRIDKVYYLSLLHSAAREVGVDPFTPPRKGLVAEYNALTNYLG